MRTRLAELSKISARLRVGIEKRAGLGSLVGRGLKGLGSLALRNPGKAAMTVGSAGLGTASAVGKKRQYQAGFDPDAQREMLGPVPNPPGTT